MIDDLKKQISALSVSEKILLVEDIWDSIADDDKSVELTDKQKKTIMRRSKELKENPAIRRKWEEIKDELLRKGK